MRGSRKMLSERVQPLTKIFFDEGRKRIQLTLKVAIIGTPTKRYLNDVSLAGRRWPNIECWLGNFVIFQGIQTSTAKKVNPIYFFQI